MTQTPSSFEEVRSSPAFIATGVSLAAFTETFLYGIIIPLLPFTLVERVNIDPRNVQTSTSLLLSVYGVGSILGSLTSGVFSTYFNSSYLPYLLGLVSLAASTAMFAFGRSMPVLIFARALQGLSSAAVWTVGFVILNEVASEKDRGRLMGYVNSAAALGYMLGPAAGGIIYEVMGYYPVYAVATALVAVDIVLRLTMKVPESPKKNKQESIENPDNTNTSSSNDATPSETTSLLTPSPSTIKVDDSISHPPVSSMLLSPRLLVALLASFTENSILSGIESTLPVHAATKLHWRASIISLAFLLLVLPTLFAPVVGHLSDRFTARVVCAAGLSLCAPALLGLSFVKDNSSEMVALLFIMTVILGVGISGIMTPIMAAVPDIAAQAQEAAAPTTGERTLNETRKAARDIERLAGVGYSAINVAMMVAATIVPLICGAVVEKVGWQAAIGVLVALAVVAASAVWLFMGRKDIDRSEEENAPANG